jgi:hypothetical protein
MKNDKRFAHWFAHLSEVLEDEMNVQLHVWGQTVWTNVPNDVRREMSYLTVGCKRPEPPAVRTC